MRWDVLEQIGDGAVTGVRNKICMLQFRKKIQFVEK
jgi:hypothetical protein